MATKGKTAVGKGSGRKRTFGFSKPRYWRYKLEVTEKSRIDRDGVVLHSPLTPTELSYRSGYMHCYRDNAADHEYQTERKSSARAKAAKVVR